MTRKDVREICAALAVVRESEALRLHLMVSIHSGSSVHNLIASGVESYLFATKRTLQFKLVAGYLKMVCGGFSNTIITALRVRWSKITEQLRSVH